MGVYVIVNSLSEAKIHHLNLVENVMKTQKISSTPVPSQVMTKPGQKYLQQFPFS